MPQETRFSAEDPAEVRRRQAAAERETQDASYFSPDPPKRGCGKSCLVGCLWMGLALTIIGVIVGVWIANNWRDWFADTGAEALEKVVEATELPQEEQDELNLQIERAAEAFRKGQLSTRQVLAIARQVAESPLITSLIVAAVDAKYLEASGLPEEEREAGRRTLRRFARGVIDNAIAEQRRNAVLAHVADRDSDGNWRVRDRVSDDDLRTFLEAAKTEADAAMIPDEPEVVDPSEELRKIIDAALQESAPAPAAAERDATAAPSDDASAEEVR